MTVEFIKWIQSFSNPILDRFFIVITMMGEDNFFMTTIALVFWCIQKELGYRLGFAYLTNGWFNTVLKETFRIPRPVGMEGIRSIRLETAEGFSFPSGHTQSAAAFWTAFMLHIRRRWFSLLAILAILLVALSRVYLGVHTPLDVLVGMAVGIGWVYVSNGILNYIEKSGRRWILFLYFIPVLAGMLLIPTHTYYKVSGTVASLVIGYMVESKYIRYDVKGPLWQQVLKFVIGMSVLLGIQQGLKLLLPEVLLSDFFRYLMMGLWLIIAAPYIFKKAFTRYMAPSKSIG